MEATLSNLGFVFLGTYIGVCAFLFNAQKIHCLPQNWQLQSSPSPPSPPPPGSPPPPTPDTTRPPPPPPHRLRSPRQPHKNSNGTKPSKPSTRSSLGVHKRKLPSPQSVSGKVNSGKIVGLTFLAFAGVMQIAVIVFLAIKKRQLA